MKKSEYIHAQVMYFQKSIKASAKWLGAEFEHFLVDKATLRSYRYDEPNGQKDLANKLNGMGWHIFLKEGDAPLGLEKEGNTITFEPGGQFEISLRPLESVKEIDALYRRLMDEIHSVMIESQALVGLGYHPSSKIESLPLLPKKRYDFMYQYFKTHGAKSHNMMKGTAATQVSIDYTSEADFIKKFRVAYFLSPVFAALWDASPIFEGEIFQKSHLRAGIWEETDRPRSKNMPGVLEKVYGFADYTKYLLSVSPIFFPQNGGYESVGDTPLEQLLEDRHFDTALYEHVQSMVFPDVRLKKYLEIRMADAMPYPYNLSVFAIVDALFYNVDVLNYWYKKSLAYNDAWLLRQNQNLMDLKLEDNHELLVLRDEFLSHLEATMSAENRVYFDPFKRKIDAYGSIANWLKIVYQTDREQFLKEVNCARVSSD